MKKSIAVILFLCSPFYVNAQTVIFKSEQVIYDDTAILLNGPIGKWTNTQVVTFQNQTNNTVNVKAHLHDHLDFLYFLDENNVAHREINFDIAAFSSFNQKIVAKITKFEPVLYNDQMGFDITYENNKSTYFEITASVYFFEDVVSKTTKPDGYHFWDFEGSPRILDASYLPLKIYSNHPHFSLDDSWDQIINKAINTWNNAGKSIGHTTNFYALTNNINEADFAIDWSGENLPAQALGSAGLTNSNPSYIGGIVMLPPNSSNKLQTAEVLVQEMGHILGLEHSEHSADIMNGQAHPLHHDDLSQIKLTGRDRQMLKWLYAQSNYVPIVPYREYSNIPPNYGRGLPSKEEQEQRNEARIALLVDIKLKSKLISSLVNELEQTVLEHKLSLVARKSSEIQKICEELNDLTISLNEREQTAVLNQTEKTNEAAHQIEHQAKSGHIALKQLNHDFDHLKEAAELLDIVVSRLN